MLHGCFTLLLVFVHVPTLLATFQGQLSIQPPHSSYSSDGKRLIENWDVGGDTQIFSNFLRLTDDRAVSVDGIRHGPTTYTYLVWNKFCMFDGTA